MYKKSLLLFCLLFLSSIPQAKAVDFNNHKGFYLYGMGGLWQLDHDTNVNSGLKFASGYEGTYGLGLGYDVNWFAPELQLQYTTVTGTTASGTGREHALTARINAKFRKIGAMADPSRKVRVYPYAKIGGLAHALYVNAPSNDDAIGAWGGGLALSTGVEINAKAFYFGMEVVNDLVFLQEYRRQILGVDTLLVRGGLDYQLSFLGHIGVHF